MSWLIPFSPNLSAVAAAGVVVFGGGGGRRGQRRGRHGEGVAPSPPSSAAPSRRRPPSRGAGGASPLLPLSVRPPPRPFFRSLPDRLPKPTGVSARSPIGPLSRPATQRGCVAPSPPSSARVSCGVAPSPPKSGGGRRLSCLCPRRPPAAPTSARSPIVPMERKQDT